MTVTDPAKDFMSDCADARDRDLKFADRILNIIYDAKLQADRLRDQSRRSS